MKSIKLIIHGNPQSKSNEKLRGAHGKYIKTAKTRGYELDIKIQCRAQLPTKFQMFEKENVHMDIYYYFRDKRRTDVQNSPKSLCDALEDVIYKNDKQIVSMYQQIHYDKEQPRTEIHAYERNYDPFKPHIGR